MMVCSKPRGGSSLRVEMLIEQSDAVCATALHASGSVLATASGQQHFYPGDHDGTEKDKDEDGEEVEIFYDNSLKLWGL